MNSPEIAEKVRHRTGTARWLADSTMTPAQIIEELYLSTLNRFPSVDERRLMQSEFESGESRHTATEDILWALLNSKAFLFNH
jgi:hypothetical protein